MNTFFRYSELRKFFEFIKKSDIPTFALREWSGANGLVLRHDEDLDISCSWKVALLEKELGINSTFYIMMTSELYNPSSLRNRDMLLKMAGMGFEIGLHFYPSVYLTQDKDILENKLINEAAMLSDIIDEDVDSLSIHNPIYASPEDYPIFEDYHNAHDERIFREDRYLSDSRMILRSNPFEFVLKSKTKPIQILLHPMHYSENGGSYDEILMSYILSKSFDVDMSFGMNSTFQRVLKDGFLSFVKSRLGKE